MYKHTHIDMYNQCNIKEEEEEEEEEEVCIYWNLRSASWVVNRAWNENSSFSIDEDSFVVVRDCGFYGQNIWENY